MQKDGITKLRNIFVIVMLGVIALLFATIFGPEEVRTALVRLGHAGPLAVILYIAISHVFAPIVGSPVLVVSFVLFGLIRTMVYSFIGSMISSIICFYISRKYGRDLVIRLVGKKTMNRIDQLVEVSGTKLLIIARIFGSSIFEVISYAFGLTQMNFTKYMMITLLASVIATIIKIILFLKVDFSSPIGVGIWLGFVTILGLAFGYYLQRIIREHRSGHLLLRKIEMKELFRSKYQTKSLRLQYWDYSAKGYYFITICTKNFRPYLGKVKGERVILSQVGKIAEEFWSRIPKHFPFVNLDEYVIMPNHIHGIIIIEHESNSNKVETQDFASLQNKLNKFGPQSKNLASIIRGYKAGVKSFATKNTIPFNWQPRFYDHIIRDERSLDKIREYIRYNVLKWELDKYYYV